MVQKSEVKFDNETSIRAALLQFGILLLFVLSTTVVALSSRHLYMYYFNHAIRHRFFVHEHDATVDEWWLYALGAVLIQLPAAPNANTTDATNERKILKENLLLGPPRLRQVRVVGKPCSAPAVFTTGLEKCYPPYSWWYEDTSNEYKNTKYYTKFELGATSIWGVVCVYSGGGYVQPLSYNQRESQELAMKLWQNGWIDRGTRVVVLEFGLFNEDTTLFDNVKFIADVLPTGGVIISGQVTALKLYGLWTSELWVVISAVVFYLMVILYTATEVREVQNIGMKKYITYPWNLVDMTILVLAYLSFIYNIWHPLHLSGVLKRVHQNPNEYQSLDVISYINVMYLNGMAICAFLVWIKILRFIHFNKTTMQLCITFKKCYKDLLGFAVFFMSLIFAYAWLGFLLFGAENKNFQTFGLAFWAVMRMVLCDFDYSGVKKANRILGPLYFLSFILIVFFILVNMFLAIILDTFQAAKSEVGHAPSQVMAFFQKYWKEFKAKLQTRLENTKLKPNKPKAEKASNNELHEVVSDHAPTPPSPPAQQQKVRIARSRILREFFESVQSKEDAEQIDRLTQHVTMLEELCNKLNTDLAYLEGKTRRPSTSVTQPTPTPPTPPPQSAQSSQTPIQATPPPTKTPQRPSTPPTQSPSSPAEPSEDQDLGQQRRPLVRQRIYVPKNR